MKLGKEHKIKGGRYVLFVYRSNNKGRGKNNCTLVLCPAGTVRRSRVVGYKNAGEEPLAIIQTSSYGSDVNLSKYVLSCLNIRKEDIICDKEKTVE